MEASLSHSLLGEREPRIVRVDDFDIDAKIEGVTLIVENVDQPGVIGELASILARNGINLAEWRLSRKSPGGRAFAFVNLDQEVPADVLHSCEEVDGVISITQCTL